MEQNDGSTLEYTSQEDVQKAIWQNIHMQQFYLAEEAPICSGPLRGSFGYNSVSPTASAILAGSYVFPPNFNQATREILEECARIRFSVPKESVSTLITSKIGRTTLVS